MAKNKCRKDFAFTLIELLVVIAIIGGLAALLVPNFMAARERGRDAQRKSDIKQIQKALEMYKLDQPDNSYPAALPAAGSPLSSGTTVYMQKIPAPPSSAGSAAYQYSRLNPNLRAYLLCACLEDTADSDGVACPAGCSCTNSLKCYYANQP